MSIAALQAQIDALNAERAVTEADLRGRAVALRALRDEAYTEACARRDAIGRAAIDTHTGEIVRVFDPALLDADTLAILAHFGTPVPPLADLYPDGLTFGRKGVR